MDKFIKNITKSRRPRQPTIEIVHQPMRQEETNSVNFPTNYVTETVKEPLTLQDLELLDDFTSQSIEVQFSPVHCYTAYEILVQLDIALKRNWIEPELINGPIPHKALLLLGRALDRIERLEVPRQAYDFIERKSHLGSQCLPFLQLKTALEGEIDLLLRQVQAITQEYRDGLIIENLYAY